MSYLLVAAVVAVVTCVLPPTSSAVDRTLTLEQALALARERAPVLVSARARIDEASGRLRGASTLLRENPVVEGWAGPRTTPGEDQTTDLRFGLAQTFQLGGERGARIAGANADRARAIAASEQATLDLLRDVATAFYRALYAGERLRLATEAESLSVDVVRIAERRYQTGDVARLDVNLARTALSRARAGFHSAASVSDMAVGDLRRLMGMNVEETIIVRGDLRNRREFDLAELLARASDRPDLRALAAEVEQADADVRIGGAQRWPELTLGIAWEREATSEIGLGLVGLTIPIFDHGQGLRDESRARSRRLLGEYGALQRTIAVEVQTGFSVYRRTVAAVQELEQNALPLLDEDEALVYRGYESGQLGLSELLLLRHEVIGTRIEYLARLLDAAVAGVELQMSAGVLQ